MKKAQMTLWGEKIYIDVPTDQPTLFAVDEDAIGVRRPLATLQTRNVAPADPNPCVNQFGIGPEGKQCGDCTHCFAQGGVQGKYYKCDQRKVTGGPATDHRVRWHACALYEERPKEAKVATRKLTEAQLTILGLMHKHDAVIAVGAVVDIITRKGQRIEVARLSERTVNRLETDGYIQIDATIPSEGRKYYMLSNKANDLYPSAGKLAALAKRKGV